MDTKPWWKSRTIWFNVASAALVAVEASLSVLQDALGPYAYVVVVGVVAGGNVILRTLTVQGVSRK